MRDLTCLVCMYHTTRFFSLIEFLFQYRRERDWLEICMLLLLYYAFLRGAHTQQEESKDETQKYKEGKYIVEKQKMIKVASPP